MSTESRENLLDPPPQANGPVTTLQLFRYTSTRDRLLLLLGTVLAVASGFGKPLYAGLLGHVSQTFVNFTNEIAKFNSTDPEREKIFEEFHHEVAFLCLLYLLLAIATFLAASIQDICFIGVSENMINHLRQLFMSSILAQDIAWFDSQNGGALSTSALSNIDKIKEGTGTYFGLAIQTISLFVSGFAVCFYYDWRLCLIGTCLTPITGLASYWTSKKMSKLAKDQQDKSTEAGGVAQQALSAVRTVMYFNGQEQECKRYNVVLGRVKTSGIHFARWNGLLMGLSEFLLFLSYCITIYVGTNLVYDGTMKPGVVITVFITVMLCVYQLQIVAPLMTKINTAKVAAEEVYDVVTRTPETVPNFGEKPQGAGHIRLENLHFQYPSRRGVPVLKGITVEIEPGQTVALVGASGSGKSTVVQLLLKFYDPTSGRILLDGVDIVDWDLHHLRNTIAVVSQEPKLFNTTIEENIRYGMENITEKEIWKVLKKANALDFVKTFPKGLKTLVGDRGTQLSGGQKQRIAIARALARDPKILLLDEATSALDSQSETIVQQALENASEGRTTLVIAHRLSTVRNADKIIAMRNGEVVEMGNHEDLMTKKGLYYQLVNNQIFVDTEEEPAPRRLRRFTSSLSSDGTPHEFVRMLSAITAETVEEEALVVDVAKRRLEKELKQEGAGQSSLRRILKECDGDWKILLLAVLVACCEGLIFPAFTFGFTELIKIFSSSNKDEMLQSGHSFAFFFLFLGVCYGLTSFINISLFGVVAERLAYNLRSRVFRNLMRQDAAYYDKEIHSPGILLTRLASDANNIKPAVNSRLGGALAMCTVDLIAYSASIYFGWQMALVAIPVFAPVYIAFGFKAKFLRRKALQDEKEMEDCGRISMEALDNIRTVKALTMERKVHENFCRHLQVPIQNGRQRALVQGAAFGVTNAIHFFMYSICFRAGLFLIYHQYLEPQAMLRSMFMVTFTSFSLGAILNYSPEYVKAKMAAGLLFKMMDEESKIDGMSTEGETPDIQGNITIKDLRFRYPEREDVEILKGLDLSIKEGETVALVGASGCGKSTVCTLLERMYDPEEGIIQIDGHNIAEMNPAHLRSNISIVSQEPVLFDMTVRENILYGLPEEEVNHGIMVEAAKKAQIHETISRLPTAYETRIGDQGAQFSGGQKQRIAIARALVRNPKILILDEATSALDTEAEKQVQAALEEASRGRSCLVVAHRLSTIRNAHQILVFHQGKVVENGTHDDLLQKKGIYYNLVKKQTTAS